MTTHYIWFGSRAVRFEGGGSTGPQIEVLDEAADFATRTLPAGTYDFTGSEWQQLLAFTGDATEMAALGIDLSNGVDTATTGMVNTTGDLRVGMGVEAQNIADIGGGGRVMDSTGTLDDSDDAVLLSGFGKANAAILSGATTDSTETGNRVVFSNDIGFGFISGSGFDPGGNALRLNDGDAINFEIRQGKVLSEASFTVKVLGNASTAVVLDSDGKTIRDTNGASNLGFVQDASTGELSLGVLAHGAKVRVDYVNEKIFVDAALFGGDTTGFFAEFAAGGSKKLTLGSLLGNNTGWSADDLVLATDETLVVNSPPVAAPSAALTLAEDSSAGGNVGATDPDLDTLSYAIAMGDEAANGTATVNGATGDYLYVPAADYFGSDSFTITVDDGNGGTTTQVVNVTVGAVNDAPVAGGYTGGTGNEDTAIAGDVDASDIDGGPLAYTVEAGDGPAHGGVVVNAGDGTFVYAPAANYSGGDSFTVTINDGAGGIATQVVNIVVSAVNDAPVAGGYTGGTGNEDTAIAGDVDASDIDGGALTYTVAPGDGPAHGGVVVNAGTGAFVYTPVANYNGGDSFTVTMNDGAGGIATQAVNIVVGAVNDAPTVASAIPDQAVAEDTAWAFTFPASAFADVDGDTLTYTATLANGDPLPGWLSFVGATRSFSGTPPLNFNGTIGLKVTASDGALTVSDTFDLVVTPVADPIAAINLDTVAAGVGGFKVFGENAGDQASFSVSSIGDLNGDGKAELLIGAISNDAGGDESGATYVVWGKSDGTAVNLDAVAAGTGGFKLTGENGFDRAGWSVSSIGDLNGDGKAELLVGAYANDAGGADAGAAYVVWGKSDGTAVNLDAVAAGTGGFKVFGENGSDFAGYSVSSIGDLNGDGKAELLVGAYANDAGGADAGAAYVVWGKSDGTAVNLDAVAAGTGGFKVFGENGSDFAGYSVSSIGDLNGDGKAELVVGATQDDTGGTNAGAVYVVWGKSDGTAVNLDAVALGTGGFKVFGENVVDLAGWSVSSIGDLNGDGKAELLIGAIASDAGGADAGAAYVVWGKADGTAVNLDAVAAGTGGFKVVGENATDFAGISVSSIGDLNGDGKAELLIGAYTNDNAGGSNAGAAYVVWGKSDGTAVNLDAVAAGTGGFKVLGENGSDSAGYYVSSIGDLNGDGRDELLVGARRDDAGGADAGAAYVVFSQADWIGAV